MLLLALQFEGVKKDNIKTLEAGYRRFTKAWGAFTEFSIKAVIQSTTYFQVSLFNCCHP
ncbi:MAG: hypothetical protein M3O67_08355 [Bacteroidota bacterium]|nr:hypothetical protein [Bacteroidota bacterium]